MEPSTIRRFQEVIRDLHGCESTYVETIPASDEFQGKTVWSQLVHVFELHGHPEAERCYVWAEVEGDFEPRQTFFAVLHVPAVDSPVAAVRASIAARAHREKSE